MGKFPTIEGADGNAGDWYIVNAVSGLRKSDRGILSTVDQLNSMPMELTYADGK